MDLSNGVKFSEVMKRFGILVKVVAEALQNGRVVDLPLSKAFISLLLIRISTYMASSLARVLLEFQAPVDRKRIWSPISAFYFGSHQI